MRNKSDLDTLSMDDLYNNLKVYEAEIKGQSSSSSNSQNVAFVSSENTSSTNEAVNTAHDVSTPSSQGQVSSSTYADDVMFSFFANQSNSPQLDNEDLEQIDTDDFEEMDLKWQVVMLTMRVKRFLKKTRRNLNFNGKETVGFDKTKVECYNCHRRGHFARECRAPRNQGNRNGDAPRRNAPVDTSTTNALVVQDGIGGYDWSYQAEEGPTDFALMAHLSSGSSSSSSLNTEVQNCSKECLESYQSLQKQFDQQREVLSKAKKSNETLQKQYDQQCEALNKYNLEIIGYQMGLESLEARIVVHEKNEVVYEEDISFLKYDVQVKDISIKDLKNQLEEALKEKYDLKLKLEKFEESSKNLAKLINSQISAKEKIGLGYDSQMNESEVVHSVFKSRESDVDDSPVNDRLKIGEGFYAVPPPYTGNYMPSRPDLSFVGLDDSVYKTKVSETETSISKTSKDIVEKPKTVRPSAPIIEEWDTDSDNDSVFRPKSDQTKPKFTKINFVKSDENVKSVNKENTHRQVEYPRKSQSPRDNRRNWNGMMTQKLRNGFESIKKACFVCGSLNHLIKDCDFHENKMVEKPVLNNKGRVTGQREIRPVWNNAQRVNHQNKLTHPHPKRNFVPTTVATKSGQVPVNAAKQSSPRAAASISTARPVNIAAPKPKVNDALPTTYSYFKAHSPVRRAFNQKSAAKTNNFNEKVNTARGNPQYTLQDQGIFDSGCSRHMTGNKSFLTDYQEIDGGFVAFGGSPKGGKITGKGKIRTGKLDFEDVYFVKELKFNLFSVSQMCDKKNSVLFTETECLVLSPDFKLLDESQVLLRVPRQNNMYSFDLKNVVPSGGETLLEFPFKDIEMTILVLLVKGKATQEPLKEGYANCTNRECTVSPSVSTDGPSINTAVQILILMDVKRAFLYGTIEEEVYVCQPLGFEDPLFPNKFYKTASTPIETNKALLKDEEAENVDVHLYRSMIGSLMYLTASRPDIMFAVCACARFQVTPKVLHLYAVKRIFRYLKGQPKSGLWYPIDSPFDLEAFSDSDYARVSLDGKSITGGCQFLGKRLISWQCKKQTIVANSTTEVEYVDAANCCGHVLWIQIQMVDYGFNFMNTKIYIDNESIICIMKNTVFHSKTKHIEIRHYFIRDSNEKKLIQVIKIHTDQNVADLLTKAFNSNGPIHLVADETVYKEWEDRMERATTTASSLEAEQDSCNINRTQSMAILNEPSP
ncbi:putative ribonuclease H-like domain-containing protein [Tanacetum coccineum]|uniref:Ribonuclease H-like domain-containing protein n=1 Tax=Tanacetum coccineum TaxID=301880 RepID=A0ABQ4YYE3_9ASTR